MLDQMCRGLQTLGVLQVVRAFPELFLPMFTYAASICPVDVLEAVYVVQDLTPADTVTMSYLHKFVGEASEQGTSNVYTFLGCDCFLGYLMYV